MDLLRLRLVLVALLALAAGIGIGSRAVAHNIGSAASALPADRFEGIPQRGRELGDPRAPVTLVEYADVQCPYCAYWSRTTLPVLVRDYVRPGKVKLVFRGLAFLGPDSHEGLEAALAASAQNRLWNFVDRLYAVQGSENSGWIDDPLLRAVGATIPGLDVGRLLRDAGSSEIRARLVEDARDADAARVRGTPAFELGRTGEPLQLFAPANLNPDAFAQALNALLVQV